MHDAEQHVYAQLAPGDMVIYFKQLSVRRDVPSTPVNPRLDSYISHISTSLPPPQPPPQPNVQVIFDNERILHARSSIAQTDGDRFLQGCYLNRDGVKLAHERLGRRVRASAGAKANATDPAGSTVGHTSPVNPTMVEVELGASS